MADRGTICSSSSAWPLRGRSDNHSPRRHSTLSEIEPRHSTLSEARSRLYQHRFLQPNSHFSEFFEICKIFTLLHRWKVKKAANFHQNFEILLNNLVDLENCRKMSVWLQKSVLIQPRTSLGKSAVSWPTDTCGPCGPLRPGRW